MSRSRAFAAVDLGAESGRVALGRFDGDHVDLEIVHRFANQPVWLNDGLHWDLLRLFDDSLDGIGRAARDAAHLDGIGIDAWGVDYALLDADHRVLGLPFHYRDRRTDGMVAATHARVSRETLYARTGIQTMPINTIFQLMSEVDSPAARGAQRLAFVPDLLGLWMTGELVNEATIASTSGLLGAEDGRWARDLIARLGFPRRRLRTTRSSPERPWERCSVATTTRAVRRRGRPCGRSRDMTRPAHSSPPPCRDRAMRSCHRERGR